MKKILSVFLLFSLLLCGGCGRKSAEPQKEEPVIPAQAVAYTEEDSSLPEESHGFEPFSTLPTVPETQAGDLPTPEPVQPPSAEE